MKRIQPRTQTPASPGYPSVIQDDLGDSPEASRRRFLKGAAAAGAALAGGLLHSSSGTAGSRRGRPRKPHSIALPHTRGYTFRYGNYQLQKAVAQTRDDRLARFLLDRKERAGIEGAVRAVLKRHTCADVTNAKRLARLRLAIGRALVARYRQRTRRRATPPTVVLYVGVPAARCKGDCTGPVPFCRVPKP